MDGGYDEGYRACNCFWGSEPGKLINYLLKSYVRDFSGLTVLDAGCGEGKNAIYLSRLGAKVHAIDVSEHSIHNARVTWPDFETVSWEIGDIRCTPLPFQKFDLVIAYGLLHCLSSKDEVESILTKLKTATKPGGYNLLCAFNDRYQDLKAHPGFSPILLDHDFYVESYNDWNLLYCTDKDLHERHPHNNVPHSHSLTRLIARKVVSD